MGSRLFNLRLSPGDFVRLRAAAARNRMTLSAFLRDAANEAIDDCLAPDEVPTPPAPAPLDRAPDPKRKGKRR